MSHSVRRAVAKTVADRPAKRAPVKGHPAPSEVGTAFVAALARRDFARLCGAFVHDLRARALLPTGLVELEGGDAAAERFQRWFGGAAELTLIASTAERFLDVVHVAYRLRLSDHPFAAGTGPQVIEQQLFCRVEDGLIASFDLLCSGFQPDVAA